LPLSRVPLRDMPAIHQERSTDSQTLGAEKEKSRGSRATAKPAETADQFHLWDPDDDDEEALIAAAAEEEERLAREKRKEMARKDDELSGGIASALAKLRDNI
jgi:DNA excision repair protein ERCC-1